MERAPRGRWTAAVLLAWPLVPVAASFYGVTRLGVREPPRAAAERPLAPTATAR
jgi:hypothetical protein